MKPKHTSLLSFILLCMPAPCMAQVSLTTDQTAFESSHPDIVVEDFEEAGIPDNGTRGCTGVFNAATDDLCFSPGDIIRGLEIKSVEGDDLAISGAGLNGLPDKAVSTNSPANPLLIKVSPPSRAVSFILHSTAFSGTEAQNVKVFDGNGNSIFDMDLDAGRAGNFYGLESSVPIESLQIDSVLDRSVQLSEFSILFETDCYLIPTSNQNIAVFCI